MEKSLLSLISVIDATEVVGGCEKMISGLAVDSRAAGSGYLFFAIEGEKVDGHNYINQAIESGAVAVVCQRMPESVVDGVTYIRLDDSHKAMGLMASRFYGDPSRKLTLVGVTGTNGKTTTATLLYDMFTLLGYKVGLLSTVVNRVGEESIPSTHTTPDAITLNGLLREMVDEGCEYCFMEVSSHSLVQERVAGLSFAGALFTNITHDHLDYHKTFPEYIKAKKMLFDSLSKGAFALYNGDDRNGEVMVQNCRARRRSFSLKGVSDYKCRVVERHMDGMLLEICSQQVWVRLLGDFNAYNLLGVYAVACELGVSVEDVTRVLSMLHSVAGRFQYVTSSDGVVAIVDYAHTPDALKNVLETVRGVCGASAKVITVVGCGGNRDKSKRPVMARLAFDMSDFLILTSDNPRCERPEDILMDMQSGVEALDGYARRCVTITDRAQAIRMALAHAVKGDIVVVAGKGHESYQEVGGIRHHFDDMEQVKSVLGL